MDLEVGDLMVGRVVGIGFVFEVRGFGAVVEGEADRLLVDRRLGFEMWRVWEGGEVDCCWWCSRIERSDPRMPSLFGRWRMWWRSWRIWPIGWPAICCYR